MTNQSSFNRSFLTIVVSGLVLSATLALFRFGTSDNDLILRYQIAKMNTLPKHEPSLDLAVLGDSSAGNGISATVLRKLSGRNVENFALTGSFGLAGSHYLMRRLHEKHQVRNFVIIQSPDIWRRNLQEDAIFKLLPIWNMSDYAPLVDGNAYWNFIKYLINPHRLAALAKSFHSSTVGRLFDGGPSFAIESDFLSQGPATFANGSRKLDLPKPWKDLSQHKHQELALLKNYCIKQQIRCLLMSGPIHQSMFVDLQTKMSRAFREISSNGEFFRVEPTVHTFPASWMGDTVDHIDKEMKQQTTIIYWDRISQYFKFEPNSR